QADYGSTYFDSHASVSVGGPTNDIFAVWQENDPATHDNPRELILHREANNLTTPWQVRIPEPNAQMQYPQVAAGPHNLMVVWTRCASCYYDTDVYGQVFGTN